jgi:hypothetical protein
VLVSAHLPLILTVTWLKRSFILIKRSLFLFLFLIIGVALALIPDRIHLLFHLHLFNKLLVLYPATLIAERRDKSVIMLSLPAEVGAIVTLTTQSRVEAIHLLLGHHRLAVRALHFVIFL